MLKICKLCSNHRQLLTSPHSIVNVSLQLILKRILEIQVENNIEIIICGEIARKTVEWEVLGSYHSGDDFFQLIRIQKTKVN